MLIYSLIILVSVFILCFSVLATVLTGAGLLTIFLLNFIVATALFLLFRSIAFRALILLFPVINLIFLALVFPVVGFFLSQGVVLENLSMIVAQRSILLFVLMGILWVKLLVADARINILLFIIVIPLSISFVISVAPLQARAAYMINSFFPLFMTLALIFYVITDEDFDFTLINRIFNFLLIVIVVGVIFNIMLWFFTYDLFRPDLFFAYRDRSELGIAYGDYPRPWSSNIGDFEFYRMTGSFADPIQWGYFLSATCLALYFSMMYFPRHPFVMWLFAVILLLLILSGAKGAWLFLLGTIFLFHAFSIGTKTMVLAVLFFSSMSFLVSSFGGASGWIHIAGLVGGINSILEADIFHMIFGYGMGAGGNLVTTVGADVEEYKLTWLQTGSESGFGVLIYQLGLLGVTSFLILFIASIRGIWNSQILNFIQKKFMISVLISYFVLFLLQENLLNTSFVMILFLVLMFIASKSSQNQLVKV